MNDAFSFGDLNTSVDLMDPMLWDPNLGDFENDEFLNPGGFGHSGFEVNDSDFHNDQTVFQSGGQYHGQYLVPADDLRYPTVMSFQSDSIPAMPPSSMDYHSTFANNFSNFVDSGECSPPTQNPTQTLDVTPGLSAIPGGDNGMPSTHLDFQEQPVYPDPVTLQYETPYFTRQPSNGLNATRADLSYEQQVEHVTDPIRTRNESRQSSQADPKPLVKQKRKRSDPASDSEDDAPPAKHRQIAEPKVASRRHPPSSEGSRSGSQISDSSSLGKPLKTHVFHAGQKPKKPEDKSWVRINTSTRGETTRTARINHFTEEGSKYKVLPLPIGSWESTRFKFEYSHHNGMDEFKKRTMSARQIYDYIHEYPSDGLRIWIQVTPSDSARRYASKSHSHCRFEQCPNRQWSNKGTIEVGSYRVAFDEKHKKYGKGVVDPYDCVGYAHLYCMERFLDFAGLCEIADVRVDTRSGLTKESQEVAAFTFGKKHINEKHVAEHFLKAAKKGALERTVDFANYPVHTDYAKGQPKPHGDTLVSALYKANLAARTRSQIIQFIKRNIRPGAFPIHHGDQEIINVDAKVETLPAYKRAKEARQTKDFDKTRYYDRFHPEINIRIAECYAKRAQFEKEDTAGGVAVTRTRKHKLAVVNGDSDDEPDFARDDDDDDDDLKEADTRHQQRQPIRGQRSSPRRKQRVDYAAVQDPPEYSQLHDLVQQLPGYNPHARSAPAFDQGPQTYDNINDGPPSRNPSCTQFFRPSNDGFTRYDLDTVLPADESTSVLDIADLPPLTEEEIQKFLSRRKSSTLSNGPTVSAMKSPSQSKSGARSASFNAQPVSSSMEFEIDDPPSRVKEAVSPASSRRSSRLANKTVRG